MKRDQGQTALSEPASYWELVPAARIYEIFEETLAPECPGFSRKQKNMFVREVNAEIFHVINLARYKGGDYGFRWGASLVYMPHEWKNRVAWHRSAKRSNLDLFEEAGIDLPGVSTLTNAPDIFYASFLHGEKQFVDDLRRSWALLRATIFEWLDELRDLRGVLLACDKQSKRQWQGPQHWPPPELVHAFTLARLGEVEQALEHVETIKKQHQFVTDPNGNLVRAIKLVAGK